MSALRVSYPGQQPVLVDLGPGRATPDDDDASCETIADVVRRLYALPFMGEIPARSPDDRPRLTWCADARSRRPE